MRMTPMPRGLVLVAVALVPTLGAAEAARFASRVPYAPLVKKLADAKQSPSKILHPLRADDLLQLTKGKRYKFIVDGAGKLAIAPLPADAPGNEYVHPILAGGAPVATAGGITVEQAAGALTRVTVDEDSKAYCPSFASLDAAVAALLKLGVAASRIMRLDKSPACAP
jgi:hypothetical protein